jgi:hypothetical protein
LFTITTNNVFNATTLTTAGFALRRTAAGRPAHTRAMGASVSIVPSPGLTCSLQPSPIQ